MPIPFLGELLDIGKDALRRVLPREKMSEEELKEAEKVFEETIMSKEDQFNEFVLKHTGEAKDMPKFVQVVRSLVRPTITIATVIAFFIFSWWLFNNITTITNELQLSIIREVQVTLKTMLFIVLAFWFGDRVLLRTGAASVVKDFAKNFAKKKNKDG